MISQLNELIKYVCDHDLCHVATKNQSHRQHSACGSQETTEKTKHNTNKFLLKASHNADSCMTSFGKAFSKNVLHAHWLVPGYEADRPKTRSADFRAFSRTQRGPHRQTDAGRGRKSNPRPNPSFEDWPSHACNQRGDITAGHMWMSI